MERTDKFLNSSLSPPQAKMNDEGEDLRSNEQTKRTGE
jgi:hypothetical protein